MWPLLGFVGEDGPIVHCSHGVETYLPGGSAGAREQPSPVACCVPDLQEKCVGCEMNQLPPGTEQPSHDSLSLPHQRINQSKAHKKAPPHVEY